MIWPWRGRPGTFGPSDRHGTELAAGRLRLAALPAQFRKTRVRAKARQEDEVSPGTRPWSDSTFIPDCPKAKRMSVGIALKGPLQHQLSAVEGFCIAARSIALHPPKPHQGTECLVLEPPLAPLRLERLHDVTDLPLANLLRQRNEDAWSSQIAVIFRNLVFQNQMIPKGIPGQFRDEPVILMGVVAVMSKNHVGGDAPL